MTRKGRPRMRRLVDVVAQRHSQLGDPAELILAGRVSVAGHVVDNPASLIRSDAAIAIVREVPLRGEAKLRAALERFDVPVRGLIALDLGAAAGGFTRVLLQAGAAKVYAVDAGFGQLLGSLRQEPKVVNLERTNLAALDHGLVPDEIALVTADLSYVALGTAIGQVTGRVRFAPHADLVGLVKPQFELGRSEPPTAAGELDAALDAAIEGVEAAGWAARGTMESPVHGSRGSVEFLLHATRRARGS
jgi:23S rRNA (cytidine1920-2'-O)/16S rRNA (cytidine1409-2'-O)-methyltransferase